MGYLFLKQNDSLNEQIYAVDEECFETLNVANTFDRFGQETGHENAGDYHIDNYYSSALFDCVSHIKIKFNHDVTINTTTGRINTIDEMYLDEFVFSSNDSNIIEDINKEIEQWCKENHKYETCTGFNYWDGNNWKSIIINNENNETTINYDVIKDESLIETLNKAIEEKEYVENSFGKVIYKYEELLIIDNHSSKYSWVSWIIEDAE